MIITFLLLFLLSSLPYFFKRLGWHLTLLLLEFAHELALLIEVVIEFNIVGLIFNWQHAKFRILKLILLLLRHSNDRLKWFDRIDSLHSARILIQSLPAVTSIRFTQLFQYPCRLFLGDWIFVLELVSLKQLLDREAVCCDVLVNGARSDRSVNLAANPSTIHEHASGLTWVKNRFLLLEEWVLQRFWLKFFEVSFWLKFNSVSIQSTACLQVNIIREFLIEDLLLLFISFFVGSIWVFIVFVTFSLSFFYFLVD